jgi:hypothetical protein
LRTTGVGRAALWLFEPHAPAMTMIKEGTDYGFD